MDAVGPLTTTTVQLTRRNETEQVKVRLKYDKDPNVLSLKDTFNTKAQSAVSNLSTHRRAFLSRVTQDSEFAKRVVVSAEHRNPSLPLVEKLWRAPLPPPTSMCSDKERGMLAALVPQVQQLCALAASRRKTMHARWMHGALQYAALLREVGALEAMLLNFIALEMRVSAESFKSYPVAAKEYALWLQTTSSEATERSVKYATVVGKHYALVTKLQTLKDELVCETTTQAEEIVITCQDLDSLSVYAKKCVSWITEVSRKWMADLLEYEDQLHVHHLTLHV